MKMEAQLSRQLALFCQAVLLGLSLGLVYDLLRPLRQRLPSLTSFFDGVYCLTCAAGVFLFALQRASGDLRGFLLLGIAGGAVLFFCALSPLLRPVWKGSGPVARREKSFADTLNNVIPDLSSKTAWTCGWGLDFRMMQKRCMKSQ